MAMGCTFSLHTLVGSRRHLVPAQLLRPVPPGVGGQFLQRADVLFTMSGSPGLPPLLYSFHPPPLHPLRSYHPSLQTLTHPTTTTQDPSTRHVIVSVSMMELCHVGPDPASPLPTSSSWSPQRVNWEPASGAGTPPHPAHHCPTCFVA